MDFSKLILLSKNIGAYLGLVGFVTLSKRAVIFPWMILLPAKGSRHDIPFGLRLSSEFSECVSGDEVASVIEEIVDLSVGRKQFLSLMDRLEFL